MKFLSSLSAVALLGLAAATANATITLPINGSTVRFDGGAMVFGTSVLPTVNSSTGALLTPSAPIQLTAFGNVTHVTNGDNSTPGPLDTGSISTDEQLTFALTNAFLSPTSATVTSSSSTHIKYHIESDIVGAQGGGPTLTLYDKTGVVLGNPATSLNTLSFKGTPYSNVIPSAVTSSATKYLEFANMPQMSAVIDVDFKKVAGVFAQEVFVVQVFLNNADFPITGGSAAPLFSFGVTVTGNQHETNPTVANGSSPLFFEGNYALTVARIPEPASLALLAVGGLLIGFRGRKSTREA